MADDKTKKIRSFLSNLITVIIVLIAFLLVGVRLFGLTPYAIIGGSMEPNYHVGSLVYVSEIDPSEITVNSVITYVLNEEGVVSTHRVVDIDLEKQQFKTKGDANRNVDGLPVHFNNVLGEVKFALPLLGYLSVFINSQYGIIIIITLLIVLISSSFLNKMIFNTKEKESLHEEKIK